MIERISGTAMNESHGYRVTVATKAPPAAELEALLTAERRALLRDVSAADALDIDGGSDPDERLEALEEHQRRHSALTRRLAEVEGALARIADGTYGTCSSCGRPILVERLVALPTATSCVRCADTQF
jgi:RNA polymerase-binding transcription factor DksA